MNDNINATLPMYVMDMIGTVKTYVLAIRKFYTKKNTTRTQRTENPKQLMCVFNHSVRGKNVQKMERMSSVGGTIRC